jgi:hypothetical protein
MSFTKVMEENGLLYTFSFSEIPNPVAPKYFVSVSTPTTEWPGFEMKEKWGRWTIIEPAPAWAKPLEDQLSHYIQAHLAKEG